MAKKLTEKIALSFLGDVPADKYFYVNNGPIVKSVQELNEALKSMDHDQFKFHRNNGKNDFYNWIKEVVLDNRLANEVARAKTQKTMQKKVEQRVTYLNSIAKK